MLSVALGRRSGALVLLVALSGLVVGWLLVPRAEFPAAAHAATGTPAPRGQAGAITPEDLWAAALSSDAVRELVDADERWWPRLPEFNVPPFRGDGRAFPGQRFSIAQTYAAIGGQEASLEIVLALFPDPATASAAFAAYQTTYDAGGSPVAGPAVGQERRTFARTRTVDGRPADELTVRFRAGEVVARVSRVGPPGASRPEGVARLATALAGRVDALLQGQIRAPEMDPELVHLLPSPLPPVGPMLGQAQLPPEAWATIDTGADPERVLSTLRAGGVGRLAFRRYALAADADQVVEIVLFPFADPAAARSFLAEYLNGIAADPASRREAPAIGEAGGFAFHDDVYELQFAVGPYVADVSCLAPFGDVAPACEDAVRQLGSSWFAHLQRLTSRDAPVGGDIGPARTGQKLVAAASSRRLGPQLSLAARGDQSLAGTWRVLSARLFYDAGGGGSVRTDGPDLIVGSDGTFVHGATAGTWTVETIGDDDWRRWQISPYGPTRKITFSGWQPGGVADGPIEEGDGRVDFLWAIFRAEPPLVSAPGTVHMKFGSR